MSSCCVSITNYQDTLCGENNGALTATTTSTDNPFVFDLYETTTGLISTNTTNSQTTVFNSLSAGTYYVYMTDYSGCTGISETIIVKSSTTFDYGLYIVNDAGCAVNSGKIFVTGLTGNPPYTYSWNTSPIQTTSSITGLSAGAYIVTVTDGDGCTVSKTGIVTEVPPVGIVSILTTDPSCFSSDGEITVVITGGTAPYNFSASTLGNYYTFDTNYTFTNVSSGNYNILITDAGLCTATGFITVTTPGGISIVNLSYSPSTCGSSGFVTIQVVGGSPPYLYTLQRSGGPIQTQTNGSPVTFNTLTYGDYTLTITDGGPCEYSTTFTIENSNTTIVTTNVTGTTCGNDNGILSVIASGDAAIYTFTLDGVDVQNAISAVTYTNLTSGPHTITVSDSSGCTQTLIENIAPSSGVDFIMIGTDALGGNDGAIDVLITDGVAPFTWTWSPNVSGQTSLNITGLTAGTYSLTVVDNNGCEFTRTLVLDGNSILTSYQVFNVCDSDLNNYGELLVKGPKQMLLEGFYDLTVTDNNCILNQAIFEAIVTVSGVTTTQQFFTGTTLDEYPSIDQWINVIKELLSTYDGIGSVVFDIENNTIKISTDCKSEISLNDAEIKVDLKIYYDISCVSCQCNCYSIVGPQCEVTYLDCNLNEQGISVYGYEQVKICGKQIISTECYDNCINPLDYFFYTVNESYSILVSGGGLTTYKDWFTTQLTNGFIVSNATKFICCPDCGTQDLPFYLLSSGQNYLNTYVNFNQSPTCCYNYSSSTEINLSVILNMTNSGLTPSDVCESNDFSVYLPLFESLIGTVNYNNLLNTYGFFESPLYTNTSLLGSLYGNLYSAKINFGLSDNDVYDTLVDFLNYGFMSFCYHDYVYMGGIQMGIDVYNNSPGTLPEAECSGLTITTIGECIDEICPSGCTSPIDYFFDYMSQYELLPLNDYANALISTLTTGLTIDNSQNIYCCPDNCTGNPFYYISDSNDFLDDYTSYFSSKTINIDNCCWNYSLNGDTYNTVSSNTNLGIEYQPKVCCNNNNFKNYDLIRVITAFGPPAQPIELSTINGFLPAVSISQRIWDLPYSESEKITLFGVLIGNSFVIGCEGDTMFIGAMPAYVNWLYPA